MPTSESLTFVLKDTDRLGWDVGPNDHQQMMSLQRHHLRHHQLRYRVGLANMPYQKAACTL